MTPARRTHIRFKQSGAAAVEFALVAIVFFFVWLGIMELGRIMYVWNTVQEVTRHAAREAVVRNFAVGEVGLIQREAIFQGGSSGTAYLPAGVEISNLRVKITYLQADGATEVSPYPLDPADNISACADVERVASCISFVRAEICDQTGGGCNAVPYMPMVSLFGNLGINFAVNIPVSAVVMPAESLGFSA